MIKIPRISRIIYLEDYENFNRSLIETLSKIFRRFEDVSTKNHENFLKKEKKCENFEENVDNVFNQEIIRKYLKKKSWEF